ncbi:MAG: hypothetical protein WA172_11385 [Terriglobales bacterium]
MRSSPYTPLQVATFYGFPIGVDGSGQCIALVELGGGYKPGDLTTYWSQLKLGKTPAVSAVLAVSVAMAAIMIPFDGEFGENYAPLSRTRHRVFTRER